MSQSGFMSKQPVKSVADVQIPRRKIKISHFDNSALIAGYSKTLIGRCMNPQRQDMKTLLFLFPRISQLEGKVVGADLGLGRFQFDFETEEDIIEVLKMEPFHFDHWMISLVRWSPSVHPDYPCSIIFWIRVLGVPIQFWAETTFKDIGAALGEVQAVDVDGGRVQVKLNGFLPLCFETEVEFSSGEETTMFLRYECLFGFCKLCKSLCHEEAQCALNLVPKAAVVSQPPRQDDKKDKGSHNMSFRGAVVNAVGAEAHQFERSQDSSVKKEAAGQHQASQRRYHHGSTSRPSFSRQPRFINYLQYADYRDAQAAAEKRKRNPPSLVLAEQVQPLQVQPEVPVSEELKEVSEVVEEVEALEGLEQEQSGLEDGNVFPKEGIPVSDSQNGSCLQDCVEANMADAEVDEDDLLMEDGSAFTAVTVADMEELEGDVSGGVHEDVVLLDQEEEVFADSLGEESQDFALEKEEEGKDGDAGKGRTLRGVVALKGTSSKKRNVQLFSSPRKRSGPKGMEQISEGVEPKNRVTGKALRGGAKPPKPTVDK
ncbi:unnamed protein product [Arabidopsis thaliana]|uniref:DUF4283 domain-containing protein n=1 Tax=Arabidopsis thaliana TaxID=3702 RepID=A0A5S9WNX6_ARATH|nr:unnamed protein product [Arabidopsis thaliana]